MKTLALLLARPDACDELESLLRGMVAPSRAEPGNLGYDLWRERDGARRFVLEETYVSPTAASAHHASEHDVRYSARVGGLASRDVLRLDALLVAQADVAAAPALDGSLR